MTPADLPPPVTGPAAWIGADLQQQPETWQQTLSAPVIDALYAITAPWATGDRDLAEMQRADMDHPVLHDLVAGWTETLLHGRGFVLARGLPVREWPRRQVAAVFYGLGLLMGSPRSQNGQGHLLGHVRDLGLSTTDPKVRIYQTTERQTFHTDSCDAVGLLCLQTAREGGESAIVSSMAIYAELSRTRPDLLAQLFHAFPTDRRGEIPPGKKPWFDMPVFHHFAGHLSAIYARRYINSAQALPGDHRVLTALEIEALDAFDALAEDPRLHLTMELQPGDIQFVHNHTILHDRLSFRDWPEPERKRHLLRLWLALPDARPLPEVYAERYGSVTVGDRGGIMLSDTVPTVPLTPV